VDALHWSLFGGCVVALAAWLAEAWKAAGERKLARQKVESLRSLLDTSERLRQAAERLAADRLKRLRGVAVYLEEYDR
jgi:hypothetical protein